MKKVLGVIAAISLSIVILFEVLFLILGVLLKKNIDTLGDAFISATDQLDSMVEQAVSIRRQDGPEEIYDNGKGDVVKFNNYKFRVAGKLMSTDTIPNGYADYLTEDGDKHTVTMQVCYGTEGLLAALELYFEGDYSLISTYLPVTVLEENIEYYMQDTPDGVIAEMYNAGDSKWYMYIPMGDTYMLLTAEDKLAFSREAETVLFGDPSSDVMSSHTYSMYETTAIENTRNMLTDGSYDSSNEHINTEVTGTAATYTSPADNEKRKQMVNMQNYSWNSDGTSDDTNMTVDLTSTTAKASEWVLTASSPYAFADNALRLHTLKAVRNAETFTLSGKLTNQITAERPYAIVIKFLNSDNELLGLRVIDKRNEPIPANDVADWSYVLSSDSGIALGEINAVQFEIY